VSALLLLLLLLQVVTIMDDPMQWDPISGRGVPFPVWLDIKRRFVTGEIAGEYPHVEHPSLTPLPDTPSHSSLTLLRHTPPSHSSLTLLPNCVWALPPVPHLLGCLALHFW
jgi:hypothetical protein